jgi:hypothetical protein
MVSHNQNEEISEFDMAANPQKLNKAKRRKNNNNDRSRELERSIEFDD